MQPCVAQIANVPERKRCIVQQRKEKFINGTKSVLFVFFQIICLPWLQCISKLQSTFEPSHTMQSHADSFVLPNNKNRSGAAP